EQTGALGCSCGCAENCRADRLGRLLRQWAVALETRRESVVHEGGHRDRDQNASNAGERRSKARRKRLLTGARGSAIGMIRRSSSGVHLDILTNGDPTEAVLDPQSPVRCRSQAQEPHRRLPRLSRVWQGTRELSNRKKQLRDATALFRRTRLLQ